MRTEREKSAMSSMRTVTKKRSVKRDYKRAILKTLTWRVISAASFFGIVLIYSGSYKSATALTLIDGFIKTFLFYGHELAWQGRGKWI